MPGGSFAWREFMEFLERSRDDFDRDIALGTTNEADLPGHYPYSQERFRLFVNGNRQFIQYDGEPPEYEDIVDGHLLKPQNSGDVVTLKTAERYRYVVQYVIEWSFATQLNQELQAGDVYAAGYGDPDLENSTDDTPGPNADGWIIYQNSSNDPGMATAAEYRNGTEVDATSVNFKKLFQTFGRIGGETNWYNVGATAITETSTDTYDGVKSAQKNEEVARVANDDGKGPEIANHPMKFSIKAGDGAGSLQAEVGSIGLRTLGGVQGLLRTKAFDFELELTEETGFEPLLAVRVDPERFIVNTQLQVLEPLEYEATDDLVLIAQIFDKQNVLDENGNPLTDANYSTPIELSKTNSVIETSEDVAQVPDQNGDPQTAMTNPGGYQVGYGTLTSTGTGGAGASRVSSRARTQKRAVPNGDVAVVMARSGDATTGTINGDIQFEQDW